MKGSIRKILPVVILVTVFSLVAKAQTNVSGGIYSNTTWTLANSPYIVVDTVVVFPGVTLTIEPGVVVKFEDHKRLEIRQAKLLAIGTITDSITFISNSGSTVPGIWNSVNINGGNFISTFSYCNFYYAAKGIDDCGDGTIVLHSNFVHNVAGISSLSCGTSLHVDSCSFSNNEFGFEASQGSLNHSTFLNNQTGLLTQSNSYIRNCIVNHNYMGVQCGGDCTIENCVIDSNISTGIYVDEGGNSIINCEIIYNGVGFDSFTYPNNLITRSIIENNSIGINLGNPNYSIYCNKICNNTTYDLYYEVSFGGNTDIANNDWCTSDSATIASHIYDGYDDVSLGLVTFGPIDTIGCYLTGCNLQITATVTNATCDTCHNGSATAHVTSGFAPYTYTWFTSPIQSAQTATGLASGTYTVCVADAHGCTACNSNVFVDSSNCTGFSVHAHAYNSTCSTCNDGVAWVSVNAGTQPYHDTWYTSPIQTTDTITGLLPGIYSVCVSDLYGCSACDSVQVSTGNCSAHFNLYPDTIIHHYYAVNMASGVAPLSYSWDWGDGSPADTIPYPAHTYASAGYYTICLTITDSVGCMNTYCNSFYLMSIPNPMVYVNVIPQSNTGISEEANDQSILVFPNPFSDQLTLLLPKKDSKAKIRIYNLLGKTELYSIDETQKSNLNVSSLSKGVHILEITTDNKTVNRKIVKQ